MRRREFITWLGGAAASSACWPPAARAQQPAKETTMPVIGFLDPRSPDTIADRVRGFRQGLKDDGFVEGENLAIEHRWAVGQFDRLPALAAELVRRRVAVITALNTASALAAKAATATIPIVFAVPQDPVGLGLVASLARPGGNATGINFFSQEVVTKRLEFLRELVPAPTRMAVLVNPAAAATTETTVREVAGAARSIGLQVQLLNASNSQEINAAFASFVREPPDALFVLSVFCRVGKAAPQKGRSRPSSRAMRRVPTKPHSDQRQPSMVGTARALCRCERRHVDRARLCPPYRAPTR
jgi:putative ABC transport system substrate-binding protein